MGWEHIGYATEPSPAPVRVHVRLGKTGDGRAAVFAHHEPVQYVTNPASEEGLLAQWEEYFASFVRKR